MERDDRSRPRLSRTLSRARWHEYRAFLEAAAAHGYRALPLERWVRDGAGDDGRTLILRHDVDQHPGAALRMAAIEDALGLRSTWYFRWRTAHPQVVRSLRARGFEVGLHYETLSRMALERGLDGPVSGGLFQEGMEGLRREIAAFADRYGPIASVAPHGDSRVPQIENADLLRRTPAEAYGIELDANVAMRGRGLAYWLTDRASARGRWRDETDPVELFATGASPILSVIHPNNWASGPSLWLDRALGTILPARPAEWVPSRPIRTGTDRPPT